VTIYKNQPLRSRTRIKTLTSDTRIANSRFFDNDPNKVPVHALTVGVGTVIVEGNVTIRTDTTQEEIDTTCLTNHLLIMLTLCFEVLCITIQDMNVLLWTVDVVKAL